MKKITAEILDRSELTAEDTKDLIEWSVALAHKSNFDPDVLFYHRTVITRAKSGDEPIVYLPLQPVMMFESLAPKPGLSKGHIAMSLYRIGEVVEEAATQMGYGEMYFLTNDEPEMLATSRRGWTVCLYDSEKQTWLMKRKFPQKPVLDSCS
jgi:hypothetical protein